MVEPRPVNRFPSRLYSLGDEPDPRFTLANERTFLAWIRTGAALLALAGALLVFDIPVTMEARWAAALVLAFAAAGTAVWGWITWMRTESALRTKAPLPSFAGGAVLGVLVFAAVVIVVCGAVLEAAEPL